MNKLNLPCHAPLPFMHHALLCEPHSSLWTIESCAVLCLILHLPSFSGLLSSGSSPLPPQWRIPRIPGSSFYLTPHIRTKGLKKTKSLPLGFEPRNKMWLILVSWVGPHCYVQPTSESQFNFLQQNNINGKRRQLMYFVNLFLFIVSKVYQ